MKSFSLDNGVLSRLPIFGRTFMTVSTKGLVCQKLYMFSDKGNASSLPTTKIIY